MDVNNARGPGADPLAFLATLREWLQRLLTALAVGIPLALIVLGLATKQTLETVVYMGIFGVLLSTMLLSSFRPRSTWLSRTLETMLARAIHDNLSVGTDRVTGTAERTAFDSSSIDFRPSVGPNSAEQAGSGQVGYRRYEGVSAPHAARDRQILTKVREAVDYQHDAERAGRPLDLLIAGGALGLVAFALMVYFGYRAWYLNVVSDNSAATAIGLLFVIQTVGVFIFSYGYELYDAGKAIRLTAIISFAAIAILAVLIVVLAILSKSNGSSSSRNSSSTSSGRDLNPLFSAVGSMVEERVGTGTDEESPEDQAPGDGSTASNTVCVHCGARFPQSVLDRRCPRCGNARQSPAQLQSEKSAPA